MNKGVCNVLISSAGRRVTLSDLFRRALAELGVPGQVLATDITPLAAAWQHADKQWVVPRCTDAAFIPTMLDLCVRENVRMIVPTIDTELPVYAANRERFLEKGTTVLVSSPEAVHIAGSKAATNRWLCAHEFPTVSQTSVEEARANPSAWPLPLIAKPMNGSASIGIVRLHDRGTFTALADSADYVIETIAPGTEHTVDVLVNRRGRVTCTVPRKRVEVRAGEVSKGVTVKNAAMQDLATRVAEALPGPFGALNIQMFQDDSGALRIVELNARFGGGFPLASRAGANFARWLIEEELGLPSTAVQSGWVDGLVMLRYDAELFLPLTDLTRD